jgi:uncharacterized protein (DUF1810 family)
MTDRYDLERFVSAQEDGGTYERALAELRRGRKVTHWMWFVFLQLSGLGHSAMAKRYAIGSLAEAKAYLAHPLLGPRLLACAAAVVDCGAPSAESVFGGIDARKLHSSVTLFLRADPSLQVLQAVLDGYFGGAPDAATDRLLTGPSEPLGIGSDEE